MDRFITFLYRVPPYTIIEHASFPSAYRTRGFASNFTLS